MMAGALAAPRARCAGRIADELEAAPGDLRSADGGVEVAARRPRAAPLADLGGAAPARASCARGRPGPRHRPGRRLLALAPGGGGGARDRRRGDRRGEVDAPHASVYAGRVVNRAGAELQNEGSMIMGLGTRAASRRIDFADGQVTNANLSDYNIRRSRDMPRR